MNRTTINKFFNAIDIVFAFLAIFAAGNYVVGRIAGVIPPNNDLAGRCIMLLTMAVVFTHINNCILEMDKKNDKEKDDE